MPRIRDLKPSFFESEQIAQCSPLARLFFQGLWCYADREGRLEDRPMKLKGLILPYDNCNGDELLAELEKSLDPVTNDGLIIRYQVGGRKYIEIPTFGKHQRVHPQEKESDLPARKTRGKNTIKRDSVTIKRDSITTKQRQNSGAQVARRALPSLPSLPSIPSLNSPLTPQGGEGQSSTSPEEKSRRRRDRRTTAEVIRDAMRSNGQ
jgi:hypothetical protein